MEMTPRPRSRDVEGGSLKENVMDKPTPHRHIAPLPHNPTLWHLLAWVVVTVLLAIAWLGGWLLPAF